MDDWRFCTGKPNSWRKWKPAAAPITRKKPATSAPSSAAPPSRAALAWWNAATWKASPHKGWKTCSTNCAMAACRRRNAHPACCWTALITSACCWMRWNKGETALSAPVIDADSRLRERLELESTPPGARVHRPPPKRPRPQPDSEPPPISGISRCALSERPAPWYGPHRGVCAFDLPPRVRFASCKPWPTPCRLRLEMDPEACYLGFEIRLKPAPCKPEIGRCLILSVTGAGCTPAAAPAARKTTLP